MFLYCEKLNKVCEFRSEKHCGHSIKPTKVGKKKVVVNEVSKMKECPKKESSCNKQD